MHVSFSRNMLINTLIDRMRLPFRKEKELYSALYRIIGFYPHNISYYKLALMHKSVSRRGFRGKTLNNERLEFLGDAILDAVVGDIVYRHFEGKREGLFSPMDRRTHTTVTWGATHLKHWWVPSTSTEDMMLVCAS